MNSKSPTPVVPQAISRYFKLKLLSEYAQTIQSQHQSSNGSIYFACLCSCDLLIVIFVTCISFPSFYLAYFSLCSGKYLECYHRWFCCPLNTFFCDECASAV